MNKSNSIAVLPLSLFTILVSSCDVGIHPTGANSLSAIIAVFGEYFLAIASIVLVLIFHLARSLSISLVLLSIMGMANAVALPISPVLALGLALGLLFFSFIVPIKLYRPKVIIDKNAKKIFEKDTGEVNQQKWKGIVIDFGVGFLLLIIEYLFFAK